MMIRAMESNHNFLAFSLVLLLLRMHLTGMYIYMYLTKENEV